MGTKRGTHGRGEGIDSLVTVMKLWLNEVRAELAEAVSILSGAGLAGSWWADQVRRDLQREGGPASDFSGGLDEGEPATLVEIAFWSGWLKGEKETMERITGVASTISSGLPEKTPGLTLSSFGLNLETNRQENETAGIASLASELIADMDGRSYRPEIEMISISLSTALEAAYAGHDTLRRDTRRQLDDFVAAGSTTSLTMLSFNCGVLAGRLIEASGRRGDPDVVAERDREREGV